MRFHKAFETDIIVFEWAATLHLHAQTEIETSKVLLSKN